jgi:hypothetical protein
MPYKPKGFGDVAEKATMAPSELQPPLNFADGGAVNWASDAQVYNTQSQVGNLAATPGGFGGMASQFTQAPPFGQQGNQFGSEPGAGQSEDQGQSFDFNLGTILQPMPPVPPPAAPTVGSFSSDFYNSISPPLSGANTTPPDTMQSDQPVAGMAKGGNVSSLINRLKGEFSKRGLDFDRAMAKHLADKGQNGDTMLAHINPQEAQMLKQAGGSGKTNPNTGLTQFDNPSMGDYGNDDSSDYSGGDNDYTGGAGGGEDYDLGNGITITKDGDVINTPDRTTKESGNIFTSRDLYGAPSGMATKFDTAAYPGSMVPSGSFYGNATGINPNVGGLSSAEWAALQTNQKQPEQISTPEPASLPNLDRYSFLNTVSNAIARANPNDITAIDRITGQPTAASTAGMSDVDFFKYGNPSSPGNMAVDLLTKTASDDLARKMQADFDAPIPGQAKSPLDAFNLVKTVPTETTKSPFEAYNRVQTTATSPFEKAVQAAVAPAQPEIPVPPVVVREPVAETTPKPVSPFVSTAAKAPAPVPAAPAAPAAPVARSPLTATTPPTPPADIPPADDTAAKPTESIFEKIARTVQENAVPAGINLGISTINPIAGLMNLGLGLTGNPTIGRAVTDSFSGSKVNPNFATTTQINDMYGNAVPAPPGTPIPPIPDRDMGSTPGIMQTILKSIGLDTESQINNMAKKYTDMGMSDSEAYNRASYDFRAQQQAAAQGTGRGGGAGEGIPLSPYRPSTAAAAKPPTAAETAVSPFWSRAYLQPTGINYYNYGYNPEGSFYTYAKGGSVGPLSKIRK